MRYPLVIASILLAAAAGAEDPPVPAGPAGPASADAARAGVWVELEGESAALVYLRLLGGDAAKAGADAKRAAASDASRHFRAMEPVLADFRGALSVAVPDATVLYSCRRALNGFAVLADEAETRRIASMPGVKRVLPLGSFTPALATSVPFISAPQAWGGVPGLTGEGVTIGIIDTGTDYLHVGLGGPGTGYGSNDTTIIGDDPNFPNARVVGGYDFAGDDYTGSNTPVPDPDPMDCNSHGSHVSGIAAGNGVLADGTAYAGPYDEATHGNAFRIGPGVAPQASIHALKVFGCTGSTNLVAQAIDHALDPDDDGDMVDHLDVVNLSLGSAFGDFDNASTQALEMAAAMGIVVVASAGNDGDTYSIIGSPGMAPRTISVANTIDDGVLLHSLAITAPESLVGTYDAATAFFGPPLDATGIAGEIVATTPAEGCTAITNAGAVAGKIALVERGGCSFNVKVKAAQDAGAVAAIIVNINPGLPEPLTNTDATITIPSVMVSQDIGAQIRAAMLGGAVAGKLSSVPSRTATELGDSVAASSSRGPGGQPAILKPDVSAPGQYITSVGHGTGTGTLTISGTSMASPHVAGMMALLREEYPDRSVEELKALAMSTAVHDLYAVPGSTTVRQSPMRTGAGRVDAQFAAGSSLYAMAEAGTGRVSLSYGTVDALDSTTVDRTVRIVNPGAQAVQVTLGADEAVAAPGAAIGFPGGSTVQVPAGGHTEFVARLSVDPAQLRHQRDPAIASMQSGFARQYLSEFAGYVTMEPSAGDAIRLPFAAIPRPASAMHAGVGGLLRPAATANVALPLAGSGVDGGPSQPEDPLSLVSVFELQHSSPQLALPAPERSGADIRHFGVFSTTDGTVANTTVYFAITSWGTWSTPSNLQFLVAIDKDLGGGVGYDYYAYNYNAGWNAGGSGTDVFTSNVDRLSNGTFSWAYPVNGFHASEMDTRPFDTDVMFLAVPAASIGLTDVNSRFEYAAFSFFYGVSGAIDSTPLLTFDPLHPGATASGVLHPDLPGTSVDLALDPTALAADGALGLLLLHHHNVPGTRAEVVPLVDGPGSQIQVY